jgi:adenylate cyclase
LNFVASETLAGKSSEIKGFTVATRVFGRGDDFDQSIDPIVSIQANKLRRALERYYLIAGHSDPVYIDIPKGTYVPVFSQSIEADTEARHGRRSSDFHPGESWPTILVRPFTNFTGDKDKDFLGTGFATEIATEISRFEEIPVLLSGPDNPINERQKSTFQFIIDGSIRSDEDVYKINFALSDAVTQKILWSGSRRCDYDISSFINLQEEVAQTAAGTIAGECGIIHRKLSSDRKQRPPTSLQTYEAILKFYDYDQTQSPDSFMVALRALEQAKELDPQCGLIWSFLARMYINIYTLEIPGFDIYAAKKNAIHYAETSVQFNPNSQRTHAVLAFVRLVTDELPAARREIDLAYSLNPRSLLMLDAIGYIMSLLGDWERGPQVIREAMNCNPYYKPISNYGLWPDGLNRRDFVQVYQETH